MIARKKRIHISHNPETRSLASFVMRLISAITHGVTAIYTARSVYRTADLYMSQLLATLTYSRLTEAQYIKLRGNVDLRSFQCVEPRTRIQFWAGWLTVRVILCFIAETENLSLIPWHHFTGPGSSVGRALDSEWWEHTSRLRKSAGSRRDGCLIFMSLLAGMVAVGMAGRS